MNKKILMNHPLGEIFKNEEKQVKIILRQMEAYGFFPIGYGINYEKTLLNHARQQGLSREQITNMLNAVNRKI